MVMQQLYNIELEYEFQLLTEIMISSIVLI